MSQAFNRLFIARISFNDGSYRDIPSDKLRIAFESRKTLKKAPNQNKLLVYNLNPESRNKIKTESSYIEVYGGYIGEGFTSDDIVDPTTELTKFVHGDVDIASSKHTGTDWITELKNRDGGSAEKVFAPAAWGKQTPVSDIFKDLIKILDPEKNESIAKSFGNMVKDIFKEAKANPPPKKGEASKPGSSLMKSFSGKSGAPDAGASPIQGVIKNAEVLVGKVTDKIEQMANKFNMDFSYQNGTPIISAKGMAKDPPDGSQKVWNFQNGLLSSPEPTEMYHRGNVSVKGVKFRVMLDGNLIPHYRIKVEGFPDYQIVSVKIYADSHSDRAEAEIEARESLN